MQSWGIRSRFDDRDTGRMPSKSGVLGLCAAGLGMAREDDALLARLATLEMAVRADAEGIWARDFQTAGGGRWPSRKGQKYGVRKASGDPGSTVTSQRSYLADASFLVALAGDDELVTRVSAALLDPVFPLFLGRRAFAPSRPIATGVVLEASASAALRRAPMAGRHREAWERIAQKQGRQAMVPCQLEASTQDGVLVPDVPLSFVPAARRYAGRYVREDEIPLSEIPKEEARSVSHST